MSVPFVAQEAIVCTAWVTPARDSARVFDGDDFPTENPFARQYGESKILETGEASRTCRWQVEGGQIIGVPI